MTKTIYGIISDIHQRRKEIPMALDALVKQGAHKIIVNGDVGDDFKTIAYTFECLAKLEIEVYIQPGSHEELEAYQPIADYFSAKHPFIIDTVRNNKIENLDHSLIFVPGSDLVCGGEYNIVPPNGPKTGLYQTKENNLVKIFNIKDLESIVTVPEKTIIICHIPRKFESIDTGVDVAEFGEVSKDFYDGIKCIRKGSIYPIKIASRAIAIGYPVIIKRENRGNTHLKKMYDKLGITKSISGHFHESAHRACDSYGKFVPQKTPTNNLFWMASYLDGMKVGVLIVDNHKVSYQNISLI